MISFPDEIAQKPLGAALVVEDNPIIAFDTQTVLEELGFSPVMAATNLAEGMELVLSRLFNFVILDLLIGDTSSLDFAAMLRAKGTRFVFASGYSDTSTLPGEFQNHAILRKPYTKAQIEELL